MRNTWLHKAMGDEAGPYCSPCWIDYAYPGLEGAWGPTYSKKMGEKLIELLNLDRADGHFHGVGEQGPVGCMN